MNPRCLIGKIRINKGDQPAAFKTLSSCHGNNPYGSSNDYYIRQADGSYDLSPLILFVRATR
ncbi:hypothetical protein [Rhizobium leguminosarum]|uniref:hypothetical protein n=1 Tax=Rhizobium leguminosarum TaxID=384 RepID=UPI001C9495FE|nr:hypothetical protein [Rhizobium leguminosarum]MBY5581827.1 hypothetical protein [Rhizobium leguminosarum]